MPFFDLEVFAKTFDVLDQIPGRVLLEARSPTHKDKRSVDGSELVACGQNARRGLSSSTLIQEDHLKRTTALEK